MYFIGLLNSFLLKRCNSIIPGGFLSNQKMNNGNDHLKVFPRRAVLSLFQPNFGVCRISFSYLRLCSYLQTMADVVLSV